MFNNSNNVDASHSMFNEVHGDHNNYNIIHGNQITHSSFTHHPGLEALQKACAMSAAFDSAARHPAPTCLPGTRVEVLNLLSEWIDNDDGSPLCWLNGLAGSGKSAIAQSIAEKYAGQGRLAASFFFSRREVPRSTAHTFFPTISFQIMSSFPSIRPVILSALNNDSSILTKVLREQMERLIRKPLLSLTESFSSPFVIVVDSLDECENDRMILELITLLAQLVRSCAIPIRIFLTSRTESHIQAKFNEPDICCMTQSMELHAFNAEDDIRTFLKHSFEKIVERNQRNQILRQVAVPWPSEHDFKSVVEKSAGLFIFAATVIKFVEDKHHDPRTRLRKILNEESSDPASSVHTDLNSLYLDIIRISSQVDRYQLVLGVVRYISKPLSIRDLEILLNDPDVNVGLVLSALKSVILVPDDEDEEVRIYHASFGDFLSNRERSRDYFIDPDTHHHIIAQLCLQLMVKQLKRDTCDIRDLSKLNSEVEDLIDRRKRYISRATSYACRYWSLHLSRVPHNGSLDASLVNHLREFTSKSLLYWMETLSLLGELESAVSTLNDAIRWLKGLRRVPADILQLMNDAVRFVLMFFDVITRAALHIYYSALPLTPTSTLIRKTYSYELVGTFTVLSGIERDWDACTRTIPVEGSVTSLNFSPDGNMAVSGSDGGVQLWNATTGNNIANLGMPVNPSCSVVFSPSSSHVAAGYDDGLVTIWDTLSGVSLISSKECHQQQVTAVVFSYSGDLLASASSDATVQLWDIKSGRPLRKFTGHGGGIGSVMFFSDDSSLVSGSDDTNVIVWDVASGRMKHMLKGHKDPVRCIAISRNGAYLASGSDDKTVRVWEARTGTCLRTYKGHSKTVQSVQFTSDNLHVISACCKSVFRWVIASRKSKDTFWAEDECIREMIKHQPFWGLKAVGLHSRLVRFFMEISGNWNEGRSYICYPRNLDALVLAVGAGVWYTLTLAPIERNPPYFTSFSAVSALSMSQDGARIMSGEQGFIRLLDVNVQAGDWDHFVYKTNEPGYFVPAPDGSRIVVVRTFDVLLVDAAGSLVKTHSKSTWNSDMRVLFSPDSSKVAYWAEILGLHVHSSSTGRRLRKFRSSIFSSSISCVVFSFNSTHVAAGLNDKTIMVWDIASGKPSINVTSGLPSVSSIAFSPDHTKIICGSEEGGLQVLDAITGNTISKLDGPAESITAVGFSRGDSQLVAFGSQKGSVRLWHHSTGVCRSLTSKQSTTTTAIDFVGFSDNNSDLTSRDENGIVTVWDSTFQVDGGDVEVRREESDSAENEPRNIRHPRPPTSRLISRTEKGILGDCLFRPGYVLREDGWILDGPKKLIWLPPPFRPSRSKSTSLVVDGDRFIVSGVSGALLSLNLAVFRS